MSPKASVFEGVGRGRDRPDCLPQSDVAGKKAGNLKQADVHVKNVRKVVVE